MRWPFRRPRDAAPLTEHVHHGAPTAAPATPAGGTVAVAHRDPASTPRSDWARLAPIAPTMQSAPPLTFHGDRFGRSVAGARSMAAMYRHRPARPDRAPSGLLLDAVKLESIEPAEPRGEPEVPPVVPSTPSPPPIHRKAVDLGAPSRQRLMASDAQVAFPDAPSRQEDMSGMSISWSADAGFATQSPRMRLLGQRPALEVAPVGEPAGVDEPGTPELRYLPAPGPRHERPPRDVVDLVEQATGVRVGDTVIDRSPEISDRASDMGAVAFTEQGRVHLPAELGDLNEPHNKAIVAHELTHVAQQRTRAHVPSEDSQEGRELEAEAREMQRRAGGVVRPHFMRRRPGSLDVVAGVQRLAGDEDQYAWQQRGESPSQQSLLPMMGWSVAAGSERERRRQHEDEQWARQFETDHAQHLNDLRERHYNELKEEALRQKRITALREDEAAPTALNRQEMLELRGQLDEDMPWEFGFPEHLTHAYPEPLPPEEEHPDAEHHGEHHAGEHEGEHHDAEHGEHTPAHAHGAALATGAHATTAGRRLTTTGTGHGAAHGRTTGGPLGHGRGRTTGGPGAHGGDHDTQYDWQHRESTDREVVDAMFGGGLFGGLLGLAVGADTDETRRNAEASTPQLHERRQTRERELRHATLQSKHNEALRNDEPARQVTLSHADIVNIRQQVDQEMPLQYVTPQYLDQHEDAQLTADGQIVRAANLAADDGEHPGAEPGGAHHDATRAAGGAAGAAPAATAGTDTTADTTAQDGEAAGAGAGAGGGGGGRGGGAIRTGLAAAAGAIIGHELAEHHQGHHDAHDDSFALDEDAAGRIFAAASDVDIDNLSRRLWSRIRREMRTELLVDRERAGSLADIR